MPFDYQGAINAGFSDGDIIDHLWQSEQFDLEGARSAGFTDTQIAQHLSTLGAQEEDKNFFDHVGDFLGGVGTGILWWGCPVRCLWRRQRIGFFCHLSYS